jgi:hypothetical protein
VKANRVECTIPGLSTGLEVEVESPRAIRNSRRPTEAGRGHGSENCDLRLGAHRRGTPAQVGHPSFTPDDLTLRASSSPRTTARALVAPLDDVCSQPRADLAAYDYLVAMSARFQVLYVFVIMEVGRTARTLRERQQLPHSSGQSGKYGQFVLIGDYTPILNLCDRWLGP